METTRSILLVRTVGGSHLSQTADKIQQTFCMLLKEDFDTLRNTLQLKINPVKVVLKQINIKNFGRLFTFSLRRLKEVKKNKKEKMENLSAQKSMSLEKYFISIYNGISNCK